MKLEAEHWEQAYKHLKEIRQQYTEIGASGILGLTITLNPMIVRYEKGERTEELYKEMMAVE